MLGKQPSIVITGCGCISAAGSTCIEAMNAIERFEVNNRRVDQPFFQNLLLRRVL